jgi:hypothetical protein
MEEGAINRGESSPAGRTMARVGWVLGIVGIALCTIFLIFYIVFWGLNFKQLGMPHFPPKTF